MRGLVVLVTVFISLIYVGVWVAEIIPNPDSWLYSTFGLLKLCFVHSLLGATIYTYYLAIVTPYVARRHCHPLRLPRTRRVLVIVACSEGYEEW